MDKACLAGTAMYHVFFKLCVAKCFFYHSASILTFIQVSHFTYFYVFCLLFYMPVLGPWVLHKSNAFMYNHNCNRNFSML